VEESGIQDFAADTANVKYIKTELGMIFREKQLL